MSKTAPRLRVLSLLLAFVLVFAAARPARADSPRRWIISGVLYSLSAVGAGLVGYGTFEVQHATDARTLGQYHAMANSGEIAAGVGAAAMAVFAVAGTMTIIIGGIQSSRPRRVALIPTGNGLAIGGTF